MPNSQFYTAISEPRFNRYLSACRNKERALQLYRANIQLSQALYGVIGILEIILRNSIDRYMTIQKGEFWLEEAVNPSGYLDVNPGCEDLFHFTQEAIQKLGDQYTHDRLIAKLTFGFWVYNFAAKEFAAAGSVLLNIFPNRIRGTRQKDIFKTLIKINDLRNRIAHYEPICFEKTATSIDRTRRRYVLIKELLGWMGCNPEVILDGIDGVETALEGIEKI